MHRLGRCEFIWSEGLEAAARRAKDAAADKDVWVLGADIARHLLRAGLLDVVLIPRRPLADGGGHATIRRGAGRADPGGETRREIRDPPALPRLEALARDVAREPPSTRRRGVNGSTTSPAGGGSRIGGRAETVWRSQPVNASGTVNVEIGIWRDRERPTPRSATLDALACGRGILRS